MTAPKLIYRYYPAVGRSFTPRIVGKLFPELNFHFVPVSNWNEEQKDLKKFPLGDIPVMQIGEDGEANTRIMCQTLAIAQYLGHRTGLWPTDPEESAKCTESLVTIDEIFTGLVLDHENDCVVMNVYGMSPEEREKALGEKGPIKSRTVFFMNRVNNLVNEETGFLASKFSIADLMVYYILRGKHPMINPAWMSDMKSLQKLCDVVPKQMDGKVGAAIDSVLEGK